jgi:hypothetical protein
MLASSRLLILVGFAACCNVSTAAVDSYKIGALLQMASAGLIRFDGVEAAGD